MTKEDIIRMAREVGLEVDFDLKANEYMFRYSKDSLSRFANLVAAHERAACAVACDEQGYFSAGLCAAKIRARGEA